MTLIPTKELFDIRSSQYEELEWKMPCDVDTFMAQCYSSITIGVVVGVEIPDALSLDFDVRFIKKDHNGQFSVIGFNSPGKAGKLILVEITFPMGLETKNANVRLYDGDVSGVSQSMIEMLK